MKEPYHPEQFNVGHAVFPGFNDHRGLVICGYEWGHSLADQAVDENSENHATDMAHLAKLNTFYAKAWPDSRYEQRIIKWFEMFAHPLGADGGLSPFDKSILQTNWCTGQANYVSNYAKFLADENVENFVGLMREFQPALLILLGSMQIEYLQDERVKTPFQKIFGKEVAPLRFAKKEPTKEKNSTLASNDLKMSRSFRYPIQVEAGA